MKRLTAALFGTLMAACYWTPTAGVVFAPVTEDFYAVTKEGASTFCSTTVHGLEVRARNGSCPLKEAIETVTDRFLYKTGWKDEAIYGTRVVFTRGRVNCGELHDRVGCADAFNITVRYYAWDQLLEHELFHVGMWTMEQQQDPWHMDLRWDTYDFIKGEDDIR